MAPQLAPDGAQSHVPFFHGDLPDDDQNLQNPAPAPPAPAHVPPSPNPATPPRFVDPSTTLVAMLHRVVPQERGAVKVVQGVFPLTTIAEAIRHDGVLQRKTTTVRAALADHGRGSKAFKKAKLALPAIVPASAATPDTPIENLDPTTANALFGFDIDEGRPLDVDAVRRDLIGSPGVVMVGVSAAGDALWAILAGPEATDRVSYRAHWKALAHQLPASAAVSNGTSSHDFERLRALAHDRDVWVAPGPIKALDGASPEEIQHEHEASAGHGGTAGVTYYHEPGSVDAADIARLGRLEVEQSYNGWLYQLGMLKSCGFSAGQVETWSSTGGKYRPGEVLEKWAKLPSDPPDTARAHFLDDTEEVPEWGHGSATPPPAPAQPRTPISQWFEVAQWWVRNHCGGRFRYVSDPRAIGWWWFDGVCWHMLANNDPRLLDELSRNRYGFAQQLQDGGHRDAADLLAGNRGWQWERVGRAHDFMVGLRDELQGETPQPVPYHLATPSGVVDLRDGTVLAHAPQLGTRGVTAGDYKRDAEAAHMAALTKRFGNGMVFSPETLDAYLKLTGLALTGLAQSYRSIVMIIGQSGSGKGDASNIVQRALGTRAYAISREWLAQRARGDIDATAADLLEFQPSVIRIDELGSDTDIAPSRLMSFTGNAPTSARRPHGPMISGTVTAQLWTTAVDVPTIPRNSGIERRLAVLPTLRVLREEEKDEAGAFDPELLDAVVSMAALYAMEAYRVGYEAPQGDVVVKGRVLDDMDEVASWLEAQEDLHGLRVAEVWARAKAGLGLTDRELSQAKLGRKVSLSTRWDRAQLGGGVRVVIGRGQTPPAGPRPASLLLTE